ncbi:hypothetical protein LJR235_000576 [Pararhizobium sp. LjRoot235]|uniref:hypothetical protein n=1 Tax=Pararhizobium sp. LjRoot235 TaxID=3342291 RepID=UPI003ECD859E
MALRSYPVPVTLPHPALPQADGERACRFCFGIARRTSATSGTGQASLPKGSGL